MPRFATNASGSSHRVLQVVAGVLLGSLSVELGLRVRFAEHEANGGYWGRGAFVDAAELPYRHAPNATLRIGREGAFAQTVTTNERGFRDRRSPRQHPEQPRIVVAGASFAFGVGLREYDELFHAQLEERLRARGDWPDELLVFNVSQTGYTLPTVAKLVGLGLDEFDPSAVILFASPLAFERQVAATTDVVGGYRLPEKRWGAGTSLDRLRTRSFLWMRFASTFTSAFPPASAPESAAERRARIDDFRVAMKELRARGIPVFLVDTKYGRRDEPLELRDCTSLWLPFRPAWTPFGDDPHWGTIGHREAATAVAEQLPAFDLLGHDSAERQSE